VSATLQFILAIGVLILCARLGGAISRRLNQPSVLGELVAGVLLGPTLLGFFQLPWFTDTHLEESIQQLGEMGVILLMFLAGMEIELRDLAKTGRASMLAGVLGVMAPLGLSLGVAVLFGMRAEQALFLGIVLSATSVSISAQTLMELGVLRRRESLALLGAAVFDDVLVILVLSVFLALGSGGSGLAGAAAVLVRMLAYLIIAGSLGFWLIPALLRRVERLPVSQGLVSFSIALALLYAWSAEALGGVAAITGAFVVGLAVARSPLRQEIEHNLSALTYGFFVPLFFVSIGLGANVRDLAGPALVFGLVLVGVAVLSKIAGSGLGAWWGGLPRKEALRLGVGMVSRGEVGLIVASIGLNRGLIDKITFAQIVLVVLATTLITPLMLRWVYARTGRPAESTPPAPGLAKGE
jgi:Kef-type K+ transport system membrane component KefB